MEIKLGLKFLIRRDKYNRNKIKFLKCCGAMDQSVGYKFNFSIQNSHHIETL